MGQQVITPPPETDRDTTTPEDEPGPGTRGADRRDREHREEEARRTSWTWWLVAAVVGIVAIVAGAFALSSSSDQTTVAATSNTDDAAAIQGEKQLVASGRQLDDPAGLTVQDDVATMQAEKEAALERGVVAAAPPPDVAGSDQRLHNRAAELAPPVDAAPAPDDGALQEEKEAVTGSGSNEDASPRTSADEAADLADEKAAQTDRTDAGEEGTVDEAATLQHEKQQHLGRKGDGRTSVPSQADEAASLAEEKAAL